MIARISDFQEAFDNEHLLSSLPGKCEPKKKIVFAKTHKTGSTSVQNIVLRYGYRNGLNFAFPSKNLHHFPPQDPVNFKHLDGSVEYDVFPFHGKWNSEKVDGIIKNPIRKVYDIYFNPKLGSFTMVIAKIVCSLELS